MLTADSAKFVIVITIIIIIISIIIIIIVVVFLQLTSGQQVEEVTGLSRLAELFL